MPIRHRIGLTGGGGRVRTATLGMALAALASLGAVPADASTFQVNPVVLEVPAGGHNAVFTIRNSETDPVSVRIRLFRWTQRDGKDVYEPSEELIASPPILTIPGSGSQLVRVGPRGAALSGAYRVILEEILPPPVEKGQVRLALRLNLPLYVMPQKGAKAMLRWSGWRDAGGKIVLQAQNDGTRYQTVVSIGTVAAANTEVPLSARFGVVLPGGTKRWSVGAHPELSGNGPFELSIRGGDGLETRAPVTLGPR